MSGLSSFSVPGMSSPGASSGSPAVGAGGSASSPGVVPGMMDVYNHLLGMNTQNYGNVLSGYGQAQGNLGAQLPGIYAGYGQQEQNVMNTLGVGNGGWGVAAPAAEAIREGGVATQGKNQQALIDAGLGNSSMLAQANNQTAFQTGQAYAGLGAQLAQTAAGYQSQFGLAGLAAQMQGAGMQTSLAQSYLSNLAGYGGFANKAGSLTGQYSASQQYPPIGGGGGHGGGGSSGGSGDPFTNQMLGGNPLAASGFNGYGYAGGYANGSLGTPAPGQDLYDPNFDYAANQPINNGIDLGGNYGGDSGE